MLTVLAFEPYRTSPSSSARDRPRASRRGSQAAKLGLVLEAGASVPDVEVWTDIREEAKSLREVLGAGLTLLCFYLYDWSPG